MIKGGIFVVWIDSKKNMSTTWINREDERGQ